MGEHFAWIELYLQTDTLGKVHVDEGCVVNGIVHDLKSGCCLVDAPGLYGPFKSPHNTFPRWAK